MHNPLTLAAIAMYRALLNLPCRCVSVWRGEQRHVTKHCARCTSMQQWRDAMGADDTTGLVVFEAAENKPKPETL